LPSTDTTNLIRSIEEALAEGRNLVQYIRKLTVVADFDDGVEPTSEADLLTVLRGATKLHTLITEHSTFSLPIVLGISSICSSSLKRLDIVVCDESVTALKYIHLFSSLQILLLRTIIKDDPRGTLRPLTTRSWSLLRLRWLCLQGESKPAWSLAEYFNQGHFPVLEKLLINMDWQEADCATQCVAHLSSLSLLVSISLRLEGLDCKAILPSICSPKLSVTSILKPEDVCNLPATLHTLCLDEDWGKFEHNDMCSMLKTLVAHHPSSLREVSFTCHSWSMDYSAYQDKMRRKNLYEQAELIHCARRLLIVNIQLLDKQNKTFRDLE
jgi:hypothetical protein